MKELKKQWKEHQFHKCYLFYGTETYLMKNYEEALVQALLPPGTESMNSRYSGREKGNCGYHYGRCGNTAFPQ